MPSQNIAAHASENFNVTGLTPILVIWNALIPAIGRT